MQRIGLVLLGGLLALAGGLAAQAEDASARAEAVRAAAGVRGGLAVHLGCGDARMAAAWGRDERFLVHGLEGDAEKVAAARARLLDEGLQGRVSVEQARGASLPYADNLVDLLVVGGLPARAAEGLSIAEILRVLAPRGVAMLELDAWSEAEAKRFAGAAGALAFVDAGGKWARLAKPVPPELDEWTHDRYGPSRTATSRDAAIGPARSLRWIDGPGRARNHNTRPMGAASANGRFFYLYDEGRPFFGTPAQYVLTARAAFNGKILWQKPVEGSVKGDDGPTERTLVASGEVVYAVLRSRGPLVALDAATGDLLRTYEGSAPDEVILLDKRLFLLERNKVRCLDEASGNEVWAATAGRYENRMAAGGGRLIVHGTRTNQIVCLGLDDGKTQWTVTDPRWTKGAALAGLIGETLVMGTSAQLVGYDTATGKERWTHAYTASGRGSPLNVFFSGGLVWAHDVGDETPARPDVWIGLDPASGKLAKSFPAKFQDKCAPGKATERYLITGRVHFFNAADGAADYPRIARAACGFGVVPANGLVYTFPTDCVCYPMLYGIMALAPKAVPEDTGAQARLERGPAYGAVKASEPGPEDWPCYRRDVQRGAAATTKVTPAAKVLWQQPLAKGGALTPPVAALGKVFAASIDRHVLHALDAGTGKPLWRFVAGGRIAAPPAIHGGYCLLGSEDGWIYALDAESGALAWRYRAAPGAQRIVAFGRLASPWPVAGGVLAENGIVYADSGRSGNLDGGLAACALDLKTGEPVWEQRLRDGALADMLVKGSKHLFAHTARLDPKDGAFKALSDRTDEGALRGISPLIGNVWANRTAWMKGPARGQLLVFDEKRTFGISTLADGDKRTYTRPANGDYRLFARLGDEKSRDAWSVKLPVQVNAMVLAGEALFVAGAPDVADPKGAVLWGVRAAGGEKFFEAQLAAPPVLDGMAAANGRLYISLADGTLVCLAAR